MSIRKSKDRNKITRTITTTSATIEFFNRDTKELETTVKIFIGKLEKLDIMKLCNNDNVVVTECTDIHYSTKIYAMTIEQFIDSAEILGEVE